MIEVIINAGEKQEPIDLQGQEMVFSRGYVNNMLLSGGSLIIRRNLEWNRCV